MDKLLIIKIGGNIIDDEQALSSFLEEFAAVPGRKILVHGGGKLATRLADRLGIRQQMVEGRRITDKDTLDIVTMVYAGLINKNIVSKLQSLDCNAVGLTGADGNTITAHKRIKGDIDYGFAGDVDSINHPFLEYLLHKVNTVVLAPITHDLKGQLLNTNADTIAREVATALSAVYEVNLVYVFEKAGVLLDAEDESTVIPQIDPAYYLELKSQKLIFAGMIPKLDNAFAALDKGVSKIIIGKAGRLQELAEGKTGTLVTNDRVYPNK